MFFLNQSPPKQALIKQLYPAHVVHIPANSQENPLQWKKKGVHYGSGKATRSVVDADAPTEILNISGYG